MLGLGLAGVRHRTVFSTSQRNLFFCLGGGGGGTTILHRWGLRPGKSDATKRIALQEFQKLSLTLFLFVACMRPSVRPSKMEWDDRPLCFNLGMGSGNLLSLPPGRLRLIVVGYICTFD